jgi:hypothetical protein
VHEVTFVRPSDRLTAFEVGLPVERVFRKMPTEYAPFIRPLVSVDVSQLRSEWSGRLHFVYYHPEAYFLSRFRAVDGAYDYLGDFTEVMLDEPLKETFRWKFRFLDPVKVTVPSRTDQFVVHPSIEQMARRIWKGDPSWKHAADDYRYWKTVERTAKAIDPALTNKVRFGGEPEWIQEDETPTGADGKSLTFIGQVEADFLSDDAADLSFYLFYDARKGVAVQVVQFT